MKRIFEVAGGTIIGRNHKETNKNNQDAFFWEVKNEVIAAVVCDGCSAGKTSEIGAKLSSKFIARLLTKKTFLFKNRKMANCTGGEFPFWDWIRYDISLWLFDIAQKIGYSLEAVIKDYFLFSIIGALITREETVLFSLGDGLIIVNGEVIQIGPFPNNEPPYIAYNLIDSSFSTTNPELLTFQIHRLMLTRDIKSILIGSDGIADLIKKEKSIVPGKIEEVGPISQFWENNRYFSNPDMIRRKLALINRDHVKIIRDKQSMVSDIKRENGLLTDDTTFVVIRRKQEEGG